MRWRSNARMDEPTGPRQQLGWFATLFAMAMVFHYTDSQPLAMLPALLAGLPALLLPGSAPRPVWPSRPARWWPCAICPLPRTIWCSAC